MKKISLFRQLVYFSSAFHLLTIYPIATYYLDKKLLGFVPEYPFYIRLLEPIFSYSPSMTFSLTFALIILVLVRRLSSRFISVPIFILVTAIESFLFPVIDGGSGLNHLMLFFLTLVDENKQNAINQELASFVSKLAVFTIASMYLTTGLLKLLSPLWQKGVAIFYILTSQEYSTPFFAQLSWDAPAIFLIFPNYLVLIFQITFPISLLNSSFKKSYLIFGIFFHIIIATVIGLPSFAVHVVCTYSIFLSDNQVCRINQGFSRIKTLFQDNIRRLFFA